MESTSLIYPTRNSSDYCAFFGGGANPVSVGFVADTIGDPGVSGLDKFIQHFFEETAEAVMRADPVDVDDAGVLLSKRLIESTQSLAMLNKKNKPIFGYCLVAAICMHNVYKIYWLGDSRAYHVSWHRSDTDELRFRCLTEDHNMMHALIEKHEETQLLQNELMDLSHQLTAHWGMPAERVKPVLEQQSVKGEMAPGEALLLMTDGIFLPLVRSLTMHQHYRINANILYLNEHLDGLLTDLLMECSDSSDLPQHLLLKMQEQSQAFTQRKVRYKDDMASLLIYESAN